MKFAKFKTILNLNASFSLSISYSFMKDACPEIVTSLLLDCMAEKQKVQIALDTIARLRRIQPEILMEECLPLLLVKHLLNDLSTQVMQNALNFISVYTNGGCNWVCIYGYYFS